MPMSVLDDPLIYASRVLQSTNDNPSGSKPSPSLQNPEATEHKGNFMIHDLWRKGNISVHIMRVVNTDTKSYMTNIPETCLHDEEKSKNIYTWRIAYSNVNKFFLS